MLMLHRLACLVVLALTSASQAAAPPGRLGRTDCFGDPLPAGALARMGSLRWRHGSLVNSAAYSPDGKLIVSGGSDNAVRLWEAATGKQVRCLQERGEVRSVAFSPDGKTIASGCIGGVRLWDAATGRQVRRLSGGNIRCVAFSPCGKVLAIAGSLGVVCWDVASGKKLRFHGYFGSLDRSCVVAFSPNGEWLAAGSDDRVVYFRATTGQFAWQQATDRLRGLAFSPDSQTLAVASGDSTISLWSLNRRQQVQKLRGNTEWVPAIAFSPDGKWLAGGGGKDTIRLWSATTGKLVRELRGHGPGWIVGLAFSPDSRHLAASSWDRIVHQWEVSTGKKVRQVGGHHGRINAIAFAADGRTLVSASRDGTVRLWEVHTGRELRQVQTGGCVAWAIACSPDGRFLAGSLGSRTVCLWQAGTGREIRRWQTTSTCWSLAFSPDGKRLAAGGVDGRIHLWDASSGKTRRRFAADRPGEIKCLAFSADGKMLACSMGREETVQMWDVTSGKMLRRLEAARFVPALAFCLDRQSPPLRSDERELVLRLWGPISGDGKLLAVPESAGLHKGGSASLYEVSTGKRAVQLRGHRGSVTRFAFSTDGKRLASAGLDGTVLVWDLRELFREERPGARRIQARELERLWSDLEADDAVRGQRAVWSLIDSPGQAVALLRRLRPVPLVTVERFRRLLAELDDEAFEVRQKATANLEEAGEAVEAPLRRALKERLSLEARLRVERLLEKQDVAHSKERWLRIARAVQVLEQVGNPEARQVLAVLAGGVPKARLTEEAGAALRRLGRPTAKP
jgi:WD40 repeat protein